MSSIKLIYFQPVGEQRVWAGPTHWTEKSMWAGPTQKKEKMDHYMLCQSYPQAQEGQINSLQLSNNIL